MMGIFFTPFYIKCEYFPHFWTGKIIGRKAGKDFWASSDPSLLASGHEEGIWPNWLGTTSPRNKILIFSEVWKLRVATPRLPQILMQHPRNYGFDFHYFSHIIWIILVSFWFGAFHKKHFQAFMQHMNFIKCLKKTPVILGKFLNEKITIIFCIFPGLGELGGYQGRKMQ